MVKSEQMDRCSIMNKFFKIFSFIPLFLLFSFTSSPKKANPGFKTSTFYDSSKALDFTDSTKEEIDTYYGDIGTRTGDDLMSYLYDVIKCDTADLSKYYLPYGSGLSGVGRWYQITDRNWSISAPIDPATFEFVTSASSSNNNSFYLYNMYISDSSNNDNLKAISNVVNGFTKDASLSSIDYVNKKKPNSYIQVDKEHVWAKNHGFKVTKTDDKGNTSDSFVPGAPTDLHHLVAADHNTNSAGHNDYMYGEVDHNKAKTIYSYLGDGSTEVSGWLDTASETFEPTDEWKGDVARCLLYMATRYSNKLPNNTQAEPYLYLTDDRSYSDDSNTTFHGVQYNLSTLLSWHEQDPVSNYEIHRNNLIYKNVQNNRNPYIDHPEWARRVYDVNYVYDASKEQEPTMNGTDAPTTPSDTNTSTNTPSNTNPTTPKEKSTGIPIIDFLIEKGVPMPVIIGIVITLVVIVFILVVNGVIGSKKKKKRKPSKSKKKKNK